MKAHSQQQQKQQQPQLQPHKFLQKKSSPQYGLKTPPKSEPPPVIQHPSQFYKKIDLLGQGSFGKAYLVEDTRTNQKYVMKLIHITQLDNSELAIIEKEAAILKQLSHPNIIAFKEVFSIENNNENSNDKLAIIMEYADGGDLQIKVKQARYNHFSEDQILEWFTQICLALKNVHDNKILHRDLKLGNVFLTSSGLIKLGDFGIARVLNSTAEKVKTMVGTPASLSPEVVKGKQYSFKADIWGLGVMLYELCTLKPPFIATSILQLALLITKGQFAPLPAQYSNNMRQLVLSMLQQEPAKRPSIDEILNLPFISSKLIQIQQNQSIYQNQNKSNLRASGLNRNHEPSSSSSSQRANSADLKINQSNKNNLQLNKQISNTNYASNTDQKQSKTNNKSHLNAAGVIASKIVQKQVINLNLKEPAGSHIQSSSQLSQSASSSASKEQKNNIKSCSQLNHRTLSSSKKKEETLKQQQQPKLQQLEPLRKQPQPVRKGYAVINLPLSARGDSTPPHSQKVAKNTPQKGNQIINSFTKNSAVKDNFLETPKSDKQSNQSTPQTPVQNFVKRVISAVPLRKGETNNNNINSINTQDKDKLKPLKNEINSVFNMKKQGEQKNKISLFPNNSNNKAILKDYQKLNSSKQQEQQVGLQGQVYKGICKEIKENQMSQKDQEMLKATIATVKQVILRNNEESLGDKDAQDTIVVQGQGDKSRKRLEQRQKVEIARQMIRDDKLKHVKKFIQIKKQKIITRKIL